LFNFGKSGGVKEFERRSQREAIEIQVGNFIYDHSGHAGSAIFKHNSHMKQHFVEMMERELALARTHVVFYHSYGNVALIYDLGACIMRVCYPETLNDPLTKNAILPRTDRSAFNNRSVSQVVEHFDSWFGTDTKERFRAIGLSAVLNCLKPDSEATVVTNFKAQYNPGDSPDLNPILDKLLAHFNLTPIRDALLQLAIEAEVDTRSFFGGVCCFESVGGAWKPISPSDSHAIAVSFDKFLDDDSSLGPVTEKVAGGRSVTLRRLVPGGQALGKMATGGGVERKFLITTLNRGHYLQLAIPHGSVDTLAYASVNHAGLYGLPDQGDPSRALGKIAKRTLTIDGQARIIARPDLLWGNDVRQHIYQFSRHAAAHRDGYLRNVEALVKTKLNVEAARKILKPAEIVVRSHNVMWEALAGKLGKPSNIPLIVKELTSPTYDFFGIQEATDALIDAAVPKLPKKTHTLLRDQVCNGKIWAALAFRHARFDLVGKPYFGCFRLTDGKLDRGRPIIAAVFLDRHVGRRMVVCSVHAPHKTHHSFSLTSNLRHVISEAIKQSGTSHEIDHVVIMGDFNADRSNAPTLHLKTGVTWDLQSAQGRLCPAVNTLNNVKSVDNVLFASRTFEHQMELVEFHPCNALGSDHKPIEATFAV
jgi:hypothetical protein